MDKREQLRPLAQKRRDTVWPGCHSLCEFHNGFYECEPVSPYTRSADHVDADVFLLLQDWCSSVFLSKTAREDIARLGHDPKLDTNINLKSLLREHFGLELSEAYGTNLFPFVKPGAMNANVPQRLLEKAAIEFALPQIRIIRPRLVICFGKATFNAICCAVGQPKANTVEEGIEFPFQFEEIWFWLQSHPGLLGRNNRNKGGVSRVKDDWARMVSCLRVDRESQA